MNPSTALATVLVDELVRAGVRHVVLCPGSRSAPLAYAAQAAEREGRLTLHVRVDERSAGFLAVGLAKLTRVPAVVVTTSGTAVANLHPAVLEAHHGVVPLIVVSADRPVELRGTGANQTTVQPGMFGDAVRWSVDAEAPREVLGEVSRWRALAADAVSHALGHRGGQGAWAGQAGQAGHGGEGGQGVAGGEPGPVHLNLQLREPLVPTDDEPWLEPLSPSTTSHGDPPGRGHGQAREAEQLVHDVVSDRDTATREADSSSGPGVQDVARTVVVVGDLPEPDQFDRAVGWAQRHGWPVVAEPFGTHPRADVLPHGPLVLSDSAWLDQHAPDRVITVGRLTLSRPVAALLRRPGVRVEAVAAHGWIASRPDIAAVHPVSVLDAPAPDRSTSADDRERVEWVSAWRTAGRQIADALAATDTTGTTVPWPSGLAVAQAVVASLPSGSTLFVGSSNSARDLDLAPPRDEPLHVVASRGLAGIDGCVSTAVGLSLAGAGSGAGAPTYALMGDLTFLHDANGLLVGPLEHRPDLTIVVTNDDGGGIFTLLEPGEPQREADFERIFATPTGVDVGALCAAHHVAHQLISTRAELVDALAQRPSGLRVLEVPLDRTRHRDQHATLRRAAVDAIRGDATRGDAIRAGDAAAYPAR